MRVFPVSKFVLMAAVALSIVACGGGGYSVSGVAKATAAPALTAGNWWLAGTPSSLSGRGIDFSGPLTVSSGKVSVTSTVGLPCFPNGTPIVISGSTNGNSITLASPSDNGFVLTVAGTTYNGNNLDGTYQIAGGTNGDCIASVGTVYGTSVPSLTGTWSGSVVEHALDANGSPIVDGNGDPITNLAGITVSLSQASSPQSFNLGAGNGTKSVFPLSGTVAWTSSSCYTTGTVDATQSYIYGNNVILVVNTDAGGTFALTAVQPLFDPSRATAMNISYIVTSGVCSNYGITGSVTKS